MPQYEFDCHDCELSFEREGKMSNPPKRKKCPKCGKFCKRVFSPTFVHFKGRGWDTTEQRIENFQRDGYQKENAERFYKDAIEGSKKRMKSGGEHYKRMGIAPEAYEALTGVKVKKANPKRVEEKRKAAIKIRQDLEKKKNKK